MVQRILKMVQKRSGGSVPNPGGAPRKLRGVHLSSRGASVGTRSGLLRTHSLVYGPFVVQRSRCMVHFSCSSMIFD